MMYETSFALNFRPFIAAPSVERYFPATAMEHARNSLARCIERGEGPGMICGPAGIGKTLLLEVLADQFKGRLEPVRLTGGHLTSRRALLQVILFELGLPYRGKEEAELRLELIEHLSRTDRTANGILLLVDEAHNLPVRLLEEIRLTTNIIRSGEPRVHLVLAGGPSLEEKLAHPKLDSLSQRLAARCYLEPFNRTETAAYLAHQMSLAGGEWERVFSRESCETMYRATAGIPRLINQVADHALLLAYADGVSSVDAALVERSWSELQQLPTPWAGGESRPTPAEPKSSVVEFGELSDEPVEQPAANDREAPFPQVTSDRADATLADLEQNMAELTAMLAAPSPVEQALAPLPVHDHFEEEVLLADRYGESPPLRPMPSPDLAAMWQMDYESAIPLEELEQANSQATFDEYESMAWQEPCAAAECCEVADEPLMQESHDTDKGYELGTATECEVDIAAQLPTAEELVVDRYARLDAHRPATAESAASRSVMAASAAIFDEHEPLAVPPSQEATALQCEEPAGIAAELPQHDSVNLAQSLDWMDESDMPQMVDYDEEFEVAILPGTDQHAEADEPSPELVEVTIHSQVGSAEAMANDPPALVVEDLPEVIVLEDPPAAAAPAPDVRRQEYRQLFARLRRGS